MTHPALHEPNRSVPASAFPDTSRLAQLASRPFLSRSEREELDDRLRATLDALKPAKAALYRSRGMSNYSNDLTYRPKEMRLPHDRQRRNWKSA